MTSPVSLDARDALRKSLAIAANDPGNVIRADGTKIGYKGDRSMGGWIADALIAGPLAPILDKSDSADRMAGERDAAIARADRINDKLGELNAAVRECLPPVDTLIAEREAAEARADRLSAEMEEEREAHALSVRERNLFASEAKRLSAEAEARDEVLTKLIKLAEVWPFVTPEESDDRIEQLAEAARTALARAAVKAETEGSDHG